MTVEIWKDIEGYEGLYQISNLGNVKSLKNGLLKGGKIFGYRYIGLCYNGKYKSFRVARLVAKAFIPNTENKPCVDHINAIRDDDRVENLRWVTHKENTNNPITLKRILDDVMEPARLKNLDRTGKHLTEEHKQKIGAANKDNVLPQLRKPVLCIETNEIYASLTIAQQKTGIFGVSIGKVCKGERKTAGGYHWQFIKK